MTDQPLADKMDPITLELINGLYEGDDPTAGDRSQEIAGLAQEVLQYFSAAEGADMTAPILALFNRLKEIRLETGLSPRVFNIPREKLNVLAERHRQIDEHAVTIGGRLNCAIPIVESANARVDTYLQQSSAEAPSGMELWESIVENRKRIQKRLHISAQEWDSYKGQIGNCIDSVDKLAAIIDLPPKVVAEVARVTENYRMRLTPYYASLIQRGDRNDPVLLQSVPTSEMVDNVGVEIPPVAADHSPARLIDQFYPRVVTIKATNMCAMYCTHCLRIAHIGKKDRIYPETAYEEAFTYIRENPRIRDVLITGGDSFVLPNKMIRRILQSLDAIEHVKLKRLGTRIPVTAPQRIDSELLDILMESNEKKPVRVVTQINTAQEITPSSAAAFKAISKSVSALLNQAVLLKGINDTRVKMWKLCETIQESYVRPYYVFNCSYRNPQFSHFRVPIEVGRDIIESMYGNISGDAIPRYIATAGGKIPLHRNNVVTLDGNTAILKKPWNGEEVGYPDADPAQYTRRSFAFNKGDENQ